MPKAKDTTILMKVAEIDASEKTREDAGDLVSLAKSIEKNGLINAIVVDGPTKKLIAGWRRLEACKLLKLEEIDVRLYETLTSFERRALEIEEEITHKKVRTWQEEIMLKKELHEIKMKENAMPTSVREKRAWGQQQTADLLGIARTGLSEDIRLAAATKVFPELLTISTKSDAIRKMYRLRELALMQELAKRGQIDPLGERITFINDDCLNALTNIKDESIDLIITDPPWGIGLSSLAGAASIDYKSFADDLDVHHLYQKVIPELFRVLKEGCHLYLFFAMGRHGEIMKLLKDGGFDVREVPMIWLKDKPGYTAWEYKPMPQYEAFFFCCKDTKQTPRRFTEATTDVLDYSRGLERIHMTEKPVELLKRLIHLSSLEGETVLDPFAGSGSTLRAAFVTKRRAIGMEKDKETYEWAAGRLKALAIADMTKAKEDGDGDEEEEVVETAPVVAHELTDDEIAALSIADEEESAKGAEAEA